MKNFIGISFKGLVLLIVVSLQWGCSSDDGGDETADYDRSLMLTNIADNIIIPAYTQLETDVNALQTSLTTLFGDVSQTNLDDARAKFIAAYKSYQYCRMYDFGPAEDINAMSPMNIFPADTAQIEGNITMGGYDLDAGDQIATKGFPAIDYLLYGYLQDDTEILALLADTARQQYMSDVLEQVSSRLTNIISSWNSGYRDTFVAANGTDASSSTGILVNQFNMEFEDVKNFKIGIPAGTKSLLGSIFPEKVEAYYSGASKELALENLKAVQELYNGVSYVDKVDGEGFDNYLETIGAQHSGSSLDAKIEAEFDEAEILVEALSDPLSTQIVNDTEVVVDAHNELQQVVVLLKTDLPSSIGVIITYQDGDGD